MLKTSTEDVCREFIHDHLEERIQAFEQLKRDRGSYGFSLEEQEEFSKPWREQRKKLKALALTKGVSDKDFERIWKEVVAELQP